MRMLQSASLVNKKLSPPTYSRRGRVSKPDRPILWTPSEGGAVRDLAGSPRPLAAGLGNRNDQTRRHNLSTILTLLAHDGPQPRALLTRRTGLNRSTIAA